MENVFDRPAGSYIQKEDGTLEPDLDDEATCMRLGLKKPQRVEKKEVKINADTRK